MTPQNEIDILPSHSEKFLELAFRTDRLEILGHPDGRGQKTGDCGDTVTFFLMIEGDVIRYVCYDLQGCIHTNACANAIVEMIEHHPIDQAWETSPEEVACFLQTLPPDHFHCAELAVGALYLALVDLRNKQRSPWKKLYD
jgi:nitrogen fixation NifU-like protein